MAENKRIPNELQMVHWFVDTTIHIMLPSPSLIYLSTPLGAKEFWGFEISYLETFADTRYYGQNPALHPAKAIEI